MPTRDLAPIGSPCWADLCTSDVEGSRRFYSELLGWEAQEPSAEFGGYFMFTRHGAMVAGGMGDMGDMKANNTWKLYLQTDDIAKTLQVAESQGGEVVAATMQVADLGAQAVLVDSVGATVGAWQPGSFQGFTVLGEDGTPSWFELLTRDHDRAVSFYQAAFGWDTTTEAVEDGGGFRYTVAHGHSGEGDLVGIMDAKAFLPDGAGESWSIYWAVDDVAATVAKCTQLGGSIVRETEDTPYGVLATLADPTGAQFKLRKPKY
jgi:predicted enzyme related to lactoylglutathione lyase